MGIDRETLEIEALKVVSPDLYYDLADTLDTVTDEQLKQIINCNGSYKKELQVK